MKESTKISKRTVLLFVVLLLFTAYNTFLLLSIQNNRENISSSFEYSFSNTVRIQKLEYCYENNIKNCDIEPQY